jgi:pimeloyl-ACP methyl ester carboxylesterase
VSSRWRLTVAGWALVLVGGGLAHTVQTADGIDVRDVRLPFEGDGALSALLYVPPTASESSPAPAVLAVHGYINSRETQSGFAIELARRGYVVLALDQTGHGFSDGRALSAGYGGPAGLAHLRSLPFVDPDRIGLEGHSMGGWASLAAASAHPDGYRSVALVGSATGPGFADAGSPEYPRNLGVVFSTYDEFSQLMWGVRDASDVGSSQKLRAVFGVEGDVEPGRLYGSIEAGTARWLATPVTTHPGAHLSRTAIGDAVTWLDRSIGAPTPRRRGDQIWYWKEVGTLVALVGGVLVLLGTFDLLLAVPWLSAIEARGTGAPERRSPGWWITLAVTALLPALTYFPFTGWGSALAASPILPQGITNQILAWAIGNGALALVVVAARRTTLPAHVGRTVLVATLSVASVYLAVWLSHLVFRIDFRFWVVALKPMADHHVPAFLAYLLPFTAFFYATQRAFHATLSVRGASGGAQYATAITAMAGGMAVLVVFLHAWLFWAGHLPGFGGIGSLFSVIAIQFVPVLGIAAVVSVFTWRRTDAALAGAVACGLLVTWYIVAGQATHA